MVSSCKWKWQTRISLATLLWMVMKMLKPSFLYMVHQPDGHYNVYFTFAHSFSSLCSGRWLAFASFCSGLWFCPTEGYCLYLLLKDMPMLQHHLQNQLLVAAIFFGFCKNILRCNWRLFSSTLENQTQWTMQRILLSLRNHWKLPRLEKTNHGV